MIRFKQRRHNQTPTRNSARTPNAASRRGSSVNTFWLWVMEFKIRVGDNFNLEKAVCNHGFFMMAPNEWIPRRNCLRRPLTLPNYATAITVSITQPKHDTILITVHDHHHLSPQHAQSIQSQVARMLRISPRDDATIQEFQKLHPLAKESNFGRIFRAPTLFEDIVKSILLCNCSWGKSLIMAEDLCKLWRGQRRKRKRSKEEEAEEEGCCWYGKFPSRQEIGGLDEKTLRRRTSLGYRARLIVEVAKNMRLEELEEETASSELLWKRLMAIKGIGSFSAANVMMSLGFYQYIPVDTETVKHLKQVHLKADSECHKRQIKETIAQIYDKYAPFQCLAYWMERIQYYEKYLGKLSGLSRAQYPDVATTKFTQLLQSQ